jgi:hypothetical protein
LDIAACPKSRVRAHHHHVFPHRQMLTISLSHAGQRSPLWSQASATAARRQASPLHEHRREAVREGPCCPSSSAPRSPPPCPISLFLCAAGRILELKPPSPRQRRAHAESRSKPTHRRLPLAMPVRACLAPLVAEVLSASSATRVPPGLTQKPPPPRERRCSLTACTPHERSWPV